MNIIIDKPQLVKAVKLYLTKSFGDLTQKKTDSYPGKVFYLNNNDEVLMVEDIENKYVYVSYDKIWSKLKHYFYINDYDINIILLNWLIEHYKFTNIVVAQLGSVDHITFF